MEIVAEGLQFPEGPIAMPDGSVILVEIKRQTLSRVSSSGEIEVIAEIPGGPNGAAIGPDGKVYVCNNGGFEWREIMGQTISGRAPKDYRGGSIDRVDLKTGKVETLYTEVGGYPLKGPNDLVFDKTGGFWFSDLGKEYKRTRDHGGLYYAKPDGSKIIEAAYPLTSPNGVGLSPDEKTLYYADTMPGRLWAIDLTGPGEIAPSPLPIPGRVVATLPGLQLLDSLGVEAGGNVCVGTLLNGGITVFSPDGTHEHIALPDLFPTNICFGGADMRDAYITMSGTGKLAKMRWPRPGLKLNFAHYP
ncbi:MAG TPA: SMP-30/gluconolactonase/LRE family protein [Parvularculaceae bacterium]|nr:SMP-30/gluconolactonase/LRE family protein [Parvularculaceae bacterium]